MGSFSNQTICITKFIFNSQPFLSLKQVLKGAEPISTILFYIQFSFITGITIFSLVPCKFFIKCKFLFFCPKNIFGCMIVIRRRQLFGLRSTVPWTGFFETGGRFLIQNLPSHPTFSHEFAAQKLGELLVGRTATFDRAISMIFTERQSCEKSNLDSNN